MLFNVLREHWIGGQKCQKCEDCSQLPLKPLEIANTMQRSIRMNDLQLLALSEKALHDNGLRGHLFKRTSDNSKWQLRWFVLFQNILFYFENESSSRPSGLIFLEGSYCDKVIQPSTGKGSQQTQVSILKVLYKVYTLLCHTLFCPFIFISISH